MVIVKVEGGHVGVHELGENMQLVFEGNPEQPNATLSGFPELSTTFTVELAELP